MPEDTRVKKSNNDERDPAEEKTEKPTKELRKSQLLIMGINMFFMGAQLSLPVTLSVYLVRDIFKGDGHSEQKIAQLTGLLAATQSFARSLTAFLWGMSSDVLGRKICIMIGTIAAVCSTVGYGSSTSYIAAVLARGLPALFIGNPIAMKAMMGDTCDAVGQAKAMVVFNLGHGVGSVIGPLLGGSLAYPCRKFSNFPACGVDGFFSQRPFALPCLSVGSFGLLAIIATTFFMDETQPEVIKCPGGWIGNLLRFITFQSRDYSALETDETAEESSNLQNKEKPAAEPATGVLASAEVQGTFANGTKPSDIEMGVLAAEKSNGKDVDSNDKEDSAILKPEEEERSETQPLKPTISQDSAEYKWWKDGSVRLTMIGSGLIALSYNFGDELAPIFVSAPVKQGGLAMSLESFTWAVACSGVSIVVFSIAFYRRLVKRFGPINLCRAGLLSGLLYVILLPLASVFRHNYVAEQICVYLSIILRGPAKICALNSSSVVVNLFASKKAMGRINGCAMTMQSGGRGAGPFLAGSIWAIAVSLHVIGQQCLGFVVLGLALICTQFLYSGLKLPNRA